MIRKVMGKNEWRVVSESVGKDGKRKVLGTYKTRAEAEKRLRQVEYYKSRVSKG